MVRMAKDGSATIEDLDVQQEDDDEDAEGEGTLNEFLKTYAKCVDMLLHV